MCVWLYRPMQGLYSQSNDFSSCHVWMWELDHKEGWVPKNWCFQTMVLEKTLDSPLDGKELKLVNPKGNQPWMCIGKTDAEIEAPILWPLDVKSLLIGKDPNAGKDWREEEKGTTEGRMARWHHQLNGAEFEQALGNGDGQGSLISEVHGVLNSWTLLYDWTTCKSRSRGYIRNFCIFNSIFLWP